MTKTYYAPAKPLAIKGVNLKHAYGSSEEPLVVIEASAEMLMQIEYVHKLRTKNA